jgi:acyl dehydratase
MNIEALKAFSFPVVEQRYEFKDAIVYALGLGYGSDPVDKAQLQFVYERDLKAVPSMCVVLGPMGPWMQKSELGIDFLRLLHGEQSFQVHRPLSPSGRVVARQSIEAVVDKGEGKGALMFVRKTLHSEQDEPLTTIRQTLFLRGDGGCGSFGTPPQESAPGELPALDGALMQLDCPTLPQQALIYRLSGDYNPLHVDPQVASRAGFERPILMGLCTMGMATRAAVKLLCGDQPERLTSMSVRFSRPVSPGETLQFRFMQVEPGHALFTAQCLERNVTVLDRCQVRYQSP